MKSFRRITLAVVCLAWGPAQAVQLGAIGPTYAIAEESALDMILKKLQKAQQSGELKKLQQEAVKRSLASVRNMAPVDGLERVSVRAQRLIDPTVHYARAISTDEGQIVVPAGAKINPLLMTQLTKKLVFFDGRDAEQVAAVATLMKNSAAKIKPILVGGSWLDLTKAWKTQVYFDQKGVLSARFGLRAVPSVISQQGAALLLQEIPARELK